LKLLTSTFDFSFERMHVFLIASTNHLHLHLIELATGEVPHVDSFHTTKFVETNLEALKLPTRFCASELNRCEMHLFLAFFQGVDSFESADELMQETLLVALIGFCIASLRFSVFLAHF